MTLILNFGSKGAAALGECDAKGANHSFGAASVSTGIKQMNLHERTISSFKKQTLSSATIGCAEATYLGGIKIDFCGAAFQQLPTTNVATQA